MKRTLLVLSLALVSIALAWSFLSARPGNGFGAEFAGSYFLEVAHEGFEEYPAIPALARMDRDGGFIASDASDFGAGLDLPYNSPVFGSWERTGRNTVSVLTLYISFEHDGTPIGMTRTTGTFLFDRNLQHGEGEMLVEVFDYAEQGFDLDPLDLDLEPFSSLTATATARRISVPRHF